jgi:signal transduction histidine kinase
VGFEPAEKQAGSGFGLTGMHERAALIGASLQIDSTPGKGTSILVRMKVPADARKVPDRA